MRRTLRDEKRTAGAATLAAACGADSGRVGPTLRPAGKGPGTAVGCPCSADGRVLKEAAGAIDDEVRRVRMLPFAEACQGLDRMVRDLAQDAGKEVDLVVEGGDVELDRSVLEGLKDPLRHLVRNAVDHGAEPPEERRAGRQAAVRGGSRSPPCCAAPPVEVVVADDGRGLDLDALRRQLRRNAAAGAGRRPRAGPRHFPARLFHERLHHRRVRPRRRPGRGQEPGRGAARQRRSVLHAGRGTRFTLSVPLTLTTLRVLLVSAGGPDVRRSSAPTCRSWCAWTPADVRFGGGPGDAGPGRDARAGGVAGRDARPARARGGVAGPESHRPWS